MKIIGHRGAAGLAPENTLRAIRKGSASGADYIELDVRLTGDNKLVVNHDASLLRTYQVDLKISQHSLKQLRVPCPELPTLKEALRSVTANGVIIELKDYIKPELLLSITERFTKLDIRFASFNHQTIRDIKKYSPDSFCYILEHHSPFEIINRASNMKADGIGLNYGVLNPLTYVLARRKGLHIYIYTLNRPWIARLIKLVYGDIYVCTDYPNKLSSLNT